MPPITTLYTRHTGRMATPITVAGEIATVRVLLRQVDARPGDPGFAHVFREHQAGDPELRRALEDDVAEIVGSALGSRDLSVGIVLQRGSLDVAAVITADRLEIELGAFFDGLREIRRLVPEVVRTRVASWFGRAVAVRVDRLEIGPGMLGIEERSAKNADPDPRDDPPWRLVPVLVESAVTVVILVVIVVVVFEGAGKLT